MRLRNLVATAAACAAATALVAPIGAAAAPGGEVIEPDADAGGDAQLGGTSTQTFRPTTSGEITEITLWTMHGAAGQTGELRFFAGEGPTVGVGSQSFTWDANPQVVTLVSPVTVNAGSTYTFQTTGPPVTAIRSFDADPYPGGDVMLDFASGWSTWSDCAAQGMCAPLHLDHRFRIVVENSDVDGDGVPDSADLCPGTSLPDEPTMRLGPKRYITDDSGEFVDRKGEVARSIGETGGCSAMQIIEAMGLGDGHAKFGILRPHLDAWIAATGNLG